MNLASATFIFRLFHLINRAVCLHYLISKLVSTLISILCTVHKLWVACRKQLQIQK